MRASEEKRHADEGRTFDEMMPAMRECCGSMVKRVVMDSRGGVCCGPERRAGGDASECCR